MAVLLASSSSRPFIAHHPLKSGAYPSSFPPSRFLFRVSLRNSTHFPTCRRHRMESKSCCSYAPDSTSEDLDVSSAGLIGEEDLLIVGPGVLGRIVAEKWRSENPVCKIFGQTMTTDHHDELLKIGITPSLRNSKTTHKFPYVIFCAPPSQSVDYQSELRLAASKWNGDGSFLFTSSTAVYETEDNGWCYEDSPVLPIGKSPRADVLLKAENEVLEVGGCVVRLAGLYSSKKGAHIYWLEKGTVDSRPDHILNLIHYEDAASIAIAILKKRLRSRVFLGCDNHPLSREELMDILNRSKKFNKTFEGFTGTGGPLGKRLNNSKTRAELGWEPKYQSFESFLGL
ncbi:unnamed protein product [Victoria cruziana]